VIYYLIAKAIDKAKRNGDNLGMDWKTLISEIQQASGMSQAAIGLAVGRSQAWVADIVSGRYDDVRWRDGEALRKLHAEKLGAGDTPIVPQQEAA
jgi:hypothetical protein